MSDIAFYGIDELIRERDKLQRRLEWLGVRSNGSERLEAKINRINNQIAEKGAYSVRA